MKIFERIKEFVAVVKETKFSEVAYLFLCITVFFCIVYSAWLVFFTQQIYKPGTYVEAEKPKELKKTEKERVIVKTVYVYKNSAKDDLPANIKNDEKERVISGADIPPTRNGVIVKTALNTETGDAKTFIKEKDSPLFAFQKENNLGISYGIRTDGKQEVNIFYERDLFRIKDVYVSGRAEISTEIGQDPRTSAKTLIVGKYKF